MNTKENKKMSDMIVYRYSTLLFKIGLLLWNRLEIKGKENIPKNGGVLIASNHASYLDPPIIGVGYRCRPVHFMARNTLWNSRFSSWWLNKVGCIPVTRETGDIRSLKRCISLLKSGNVVSVFPEGTRSRDGKLQKVKSGIGFIIEKSECTVIPTYIHKSFIAFSHKSKFIKPIKITIAFGHPITKDEFLKLGTGREAYEKYSSLIMEKIGILYDQYKNS